MSVQSSSKPLRVALWVAQTLIFIAFILFGCMKLFLPVQQLASMWVWPGEVPEWFLRLMGAIDVAGGVGILLPALTRIQPRLGVLAALGCVVLQLAAIMFHSSRGEFAALPLNFILLALVSFILWGRGSKAPIAPRGQNV
ncbi:DoxX family protein [Duganella sp. FT80W]|uniref:DoxX family protein n=1 Tax=Duganella guangzhouensis TaxID=2666084 RepID=A0A6I2L9G2_9BURK|nr:DoxX family protein [Duganella guangzhouensis]MRW93494.1 DoxX family protein [Duganella guangzhouensis]